jgi:hypothetical protein
MTRPSSPGAGAALKPKIWWSAAQALSWIIVGVPLEWGKWDNTDYKMGLKLEQAQIELGTAIGAERVKARGRRAQHKPYKTIPSEQFRIPGLVVVVNPLGELATIPAHKIETTYEGRRWSDINKFDPDEIKREFPEPLLGPLPEQPGDHKEPPSGPQPPAPDSGEVQTLSATESGKARRRPLRWQMRETIIGRCYLNGVPDDVATGTVRQQVSDAWSGECTTRGVNAAKYPAPGWHAVNRHLGRER